MEQSNQQRRAFKRKIIQFPLVYSFSDGALEDCEWYEADTIDIGPVPGGGIAFYTHMENIEAGANIRLVFFMDLEMMEQWDREHVRFPLYEGTVSNFNKDEYGNRVGVSIQQ